MAGTDAHTIDRWLATLNDAKVLQLLEKQEQGYREHIANELRGVANRVFSRGRVKRTVEELNSALEHYEYELAMFYCMADGLGAQVARNSLLENAMLESLLVHTRILHEMFYPVRPQKNTVIAQDYPGDWDSIKPPEPPEFQNAAVLRGSTGSKNPHQAQAPMRLKDYINKEIVHLTYDRIAVKQKGWLFKRIVELMFEPIGRFADLLAEARKSGRLPHPYGGKSQTS